MKLNKEEEIGLIKQAQRGDVQAFEKLIYSYDRTVLNIASNYRQSSEEAKDIYQEVFIRVFRGLKNFQFKSEFSTWLYRITANVCISHSKIKNRVMIDSIDRIAGSSEEDGVYVRELLPGAEKTDEQAIAGDISQHINEALDRLPNRQRLSFTLKYYDGYKIREIASIMCCSEGAVKRYIFLAVNKMREKLQFLADDK